MRFIGTQAKGIRLPIISKGDNLPAIVADTVAAACKAENITLKSSDIIGVTEAIVAKAQGNYASIQAIGSDIRKKFPGGTVGLVFPILSRNRFMNILKGIAAGADKVYVLLQYPSDEVGNPIMDIETIDDIENELVNKPIPAQRFREITNNYKHPFTNQDYAAIYESLSPNIEVFMSDDPRDILKLTKDVLVAEIHTRLRTQKRLKKAGANTVYTLSDIMTTSIDGSGFNPDHGVLGSNISTGDMLKLFPRDCDTFVQAVRAGIKERTGVELEVLVYGDGAFKDPAHGIWELADPVVSPAHTERLGGKPDEIKIKYVADNEFADLNSDEKKAAITNMIKEKHTKPEDMLREGTTPRKYADLIGSLCDLMSGSGDKGTPVILIQGYFDDYSME